MAKNTDLIRIHKIGGGTIARSTKASDFNSKFPNFAAVADHFDSYSDGRAMAQWILYIANAALDRSDLTEKERRSLRDGIRAINTCLRIMENLDMRSRLIVARGLEAVALIARYASPGDLQEQRILRLFQDDAAANARVGRKEKLAEFDSAVKAEAEALNITPAKSDKFAEAVAEAVQRRLRLKKQPGASRIKASVGRIRASKSKKKVEIDNTALS